VFYQKAVFEEKQGTGVLPNLMFEKKLFEQEKNRFVRIKTNGPKLLMLCGHHVYTLHDDKVSIPYLNIQCLFYTKINNK